MVSLWITSEENTKSLPFPCQWQFSQSIYHKCFNFNKMCIPPLQKCIYQWIWICYGLNLLKKILVQSVCFIKGKLTDKYWLHPGKRPAHFADIEKMNFIQWYSELNPHWLHMFQFSFCQYTWSKNPLLSLQK